MSAPGTPLYLQWEFWSAVAAVAALVLSQLPPIRVMLKGAKLRLDTPDQLTVSHRMGNPNLYFHLTFHNGGGTSIRILRMELVARRGDDQPFSLPGHNFSVPGSDNIILAPFTLDVGRQWSAGVAFYPNLTREQDQQLRVLQRNLRNDLMQKRANLPDNAPDVEADAANVEPFVTIYQTRNRWRAGEYSLTLRVATEPESAAIERNFRFTLFESDSQELAALTNSYRFGYWILFDPKITPYQNQFITVQLSQV